MLSPTSRQLISQQYEARRSLHDALKDEIIFEITNALDQSGIKYHSVLARVKELSSLLAKIDGRDTELTVDAVSDIVGARIVTLFLSDINRIIELLSKTFDVAVTDNKIDDTDPRLFGYFSVHVDAKLKSSFCGTRYDQIKHILFEIQVRTIAMDAWAAASHYLDYKSDADVPSDLRRDFNALSGLFYVADKHFETFFRARTAKRKLIERAFQGDHPPVHGALDLDTFSAFLRDRYPTRRHADSDVISEALGEIRGLGFTDLATLKAALDEAEPWFAEYERADPLGDFADRRGRLSSLPMERRYADVGVVRLSLFKGPVGREKTNSETLAAMTADEAVRRPVVENT